MFKKETFLYIFTFFFQTNRRKDDRMNLDIRNYIEDNFKNATTDDIKESIEEALSSKEEVTLPGLGVFFELLWKNSSEEERETILNKIHDQTKKD